MTSRPWVTLAALLTACAAANRPAEPEPKLVARPPEHIAPCAPAPDSLAWDVTAVDETARLIDGPTPDYPDEMRGASGWVEVRFVIDATGRVEPCNLRVLRASDPGFISSALRAAVRQRFTPGTRDGRAVRQVVSQRVSYEVAGG